MIASLAALAFLTASAAAGDCEQAVSPAELEAAITDAEQAAGRNAELFAAAVGFTTRELPCIEHVLEPAQAARLHRVLGLQALVQGQRDQALSSFAASHRIEPDYRFSTEVFPPSHPIARLYAEASTPTTDSEPAPWSVGTVSWYDGTKAQLRPSSSATILQRGAPEGERVWTHYLMPDQPLPPTPLVAYAEEHRAQPGAPPAPEPPAQQATASPLEAAPLPAPSSDAAPRWVKPGLVGIAGAAAVAAAGSLVVAGSVAADYRDNEHSLAELDSLKARNNRLVYTAGGLGVVALGAGVSVAVTW
jgi:hypothetical protein